EVALLGGCSLWRPSIVAPPDIRARLENISLGKLQLALLLEVVVEERELDLLAKELACLGGKAHVAKAVAVRSLPATVVPWPHHENVVGAWARFLHGPVDVERAKEVLGIEPPADGHHGGANALQVAAEVPRLPDVIVGSVRHQVSPEGNLILEVLLVDVGKR